MILPTLVGASTSKGTVPGCESSTHTCCGRPLKTGCCCCCDEFASSASAAEDDWLLLLLLLLLAFGTLQLNRESAGGAIAGAASYMPW
jgi:hypothetical protein